MKTNYFLMLLLLTITFQYSKIVAQEERKISFGFNLGVNNAFMSGTDEISKSIIKPTQPSLGINFGGVMKLKYSKNNSLIATLYLASFEKNSAVYRESMLIGLSSSTPGLSIFNALDFSKNSKYSFSALLGVHFDVKPFSSSGVNQFFNTTGEIEWTVTQNSLKGLYTSLCGGLSIERYINRRRIGFQFLFYKGFQIRNTYVYQQFNPIEVMKTNYKGNHIKIQVQWYFGKKKTE